jgi:hypothetical protein
MSLSFLDVTGSGTACLARKRYVTVLCCPSLCCTVLRCALKCCVVCCSALCRTVLCCVTVHITVLHAYCTIPYISIALYRTSCIPPRITLQCIPRVTFNTSNSFPCFKLPFTSLFRAFQCDLVSSKLKEGLPLMKIIDEVG